MLALFALGIRKGKLKRNGTTRVAQLTTQTMQRIDQLGAQSHAKHRGPRASAPVDVAQPGTEVRNRGEEESSQKEIRKEEIVL